MADRKSAESKKESKPRRSVAASASDLTLLVVGLGLIVAGANNTAVKLAAHRRRRKVRMAEIRTLLRSRQAKEVRRHNDEYC